MLEEGLFEEMIFSRSWKTKRGQQGVLCAEKTCEQEGQRSLRLENRHAEITQGQESWEGGGQSMLRVLRSCCISPYFGRCSASLLPLVYFPIFQAECGPFKGRAVLCFAHDCIFGTSAFNASWMDEMGSWALTA